MKSLLRKKPPAEPKSAPPPLSRPAPTSAPPPPADLPLYARFASAKQALAQHDVAGKPRLVVSGPKPLGKSGRVAAQADVDERRRTNDDGGDPRRRLGRGSPVELQVNPHGGQPVQAAPLRPVPQSQLSEHAAVDSPPSMGRPLPPDSRPHARGTHSTQPVPKSAPQLPALERVPGSPPSSEQPLSWLADFIATEMPRQNPRDILPSPPISPVVSTRAQQGNASAPTRSAVSSVESPRTTKTELPALPIPDSDRAPINYMQPSPSGLPVSITSPPSSATPPVFNRSQNDPLPSNVIPLHPSNSRRDLRGHVPTSPPATRGPTQAPPDPDPPSEHRRQSTYKGPTVPRHAPPPTPVPLQMPSKTLPSPTFQDLPWRKSSKPSVQNFDPPPPIRSQTYPNPHHSQVLTPPQSSDGHPRMSEEVQASQPGRRGSQARSPVRGQPLIFASMDPQPEEQPVPAPARRGPLIFASRDQPEPRREPPSASQVYSNGDPPRGAFGSLVPSQRVETRAEAETTSRSLLKKPSRGASLHRDSQVESRRPDVEHYPLPPTPQELQHSQLPQRRAHQSYAQPTPIREPSVPPSPPHLRKYGHHTFSYGSADLAHGQSEMVPAPQISSLREELSTSPSHPRKTSRSRQGTVSVASSDISDGATSQRRSPSKRPISKHRPVTPVSPPLPPPPPLAPPAEIQPQRVVRKSSHAPSVAAAAIPDTPPSVPDKTDVRFTQGEQPASFKEPVDLDTRYGARTPVKDGSPDAARPLPDEPTTAADASDASQALEGDAVFVSEVRPRHPITPPSPEEYSRSRARRRGEWLEKAPPEDVADVVERALPTFYPLARHLQEPGLLAGLLSYLSFYDWLVLLNVSKEIKAMLNEKKYLHDDVLEQFLGTVGYARWNWPTPEPLRLSLKELCAYMRGVSLPTHEYAHAASAAFSSPPSPEQQGSVRGLKKATRAYSRVVLRLRAQAEAEAEQIAAFRRIMPGHSSNGGGRQNNANGPPPSWSAGAAMAASPRRGLSRQASRAPSPTNSAWSHSTSQVHLPLAHPDRQGTSSPTSSRFRSPLFRLRRAPLLQVFVPSPEGDWLSDASILECEAELKKAGVMGFLRAGDVVWDTAVGDEGNVGRLVWDGRYLIDLDYTYSQIGDLPRYLPTLAFPPSYFHRVIRIAGDKNPICHIDVRFWAEEIASNLQLLQDRIKTETPQGNYHTVVRWVHRSSFTIRPPQSVQTPLIVMPTKERRGVDAGWYGLVIVEAEGTNEGLADLQERCQGAFPPRAGAPMRKGEREKTVWRILRERSRPGEIWIRAVTYKERLLP